MNKFLTLLLLAVLLVDSAGCAGVQKKFIRKKKEPKRTVSSVYFEEGAYQKKFSNDYYYKTHFTLWKSWHDELLIQLGGNQKKVERCSQEALGHLVEINRYLLPEKQAELKPLIDEMSHINQKIERGYSNAEEGAIRFDLERLKRTISNNFFYDKVEKSILPESVMLEEPAEGEEALEEAETEAEGG